MIDAVVKQHPNEALVFQKIATELVLTLIQKEKTLLKHSGKGT
jgi:hypothetical protein